MLNPETIKIIDPACGSGHILVEAYDILKAIYLERGYRLRDIPKLILENNLFGLDIDDRAAQLAGFALMMKAREDDRRIFTRDIKLNVLALQSTQNLNLPELWRKLSLNKEVKSGTTASIFEDAQTNLIDAVDDADFTTLEKILALFEQAKTFGSLIQVPADKTDFLHDLKKQLLPLIEQGDSYQKPAAMALLPFVQQAWLLAQRYDAVIANPPYMGGKYQIPVVKKYLKDNFNGYEKDLFSAFIVRNLQLAKEQGQLGFMTPFVWMFISSYEKLREKLIDDAIISTLIQLEYSGFDGATVPICTFTLSANHIKDYVGGYIKLSDFKGHQNQAPKTLEAIQNKSCGWFYQVKPDDFKKIPGSPVAYWISENMLSAFSEQKSLGEIAVGKHGMSTGNNNRFVRYWQELEIKKIGFSFPNRESAANSNLKWFPYNKGGSYRKWYGNHDVVVNYQQNGYEMVEGAKDGSNTGFRHDGRDSYFKASASWSFISSTYFGVRYFPQGFVFDVAGSSLFPSDEDIKSVVGFLCSKVAPKLMEALNATLNFQVGNVISLPFIRLNVEECVNNAIELEKTDWNNYETSWDFTENPLIRQKQNTSSATISSVIPAGMPESSHRDVNLSAYTSAQSNIGANTDLPSVALDSGIPAGMTAFENNAANPTPNTLEHCFNQWQTQNRNAIAKMQRLEQENNRLFLDAYGLPDELKPDVPLEQITLTINPKYRYGGNLSDEELAQRFQSDTLDELISYAIGCMMGRYRLDKTGLIYAHAGNIDFDKIYNEEPVGWVSDSVTQQYEATDVGLRYANPTYTTNPFIADDDGIIPLTDQPWFKDDATNRFREFVRTVWGEAYLQLNLDFVAESLCLSSLKPKKSENSLETIRRYLSIQFYKDHLKTYKKRPIYWLFSSGKQKAFECLVYLHRYNESTLPRMRTEYVTPLLGKYDAFAGQLNKKIEDATTSEAVQLKKDLAALEKKQTELREFDDKLKHYADMRIKLDLDDGVKVNYGKFGDLLAEVKAVTGSKENS